jgi:hypothetical protein
MIMGDYDSDEG